MKKNNNPYATNKGGKIEAPKKVNKEPKATTIKGTDLRIKKGGK